jgi:hypothetical protein
MDHTLRSCPRRFRAFIPLAIKIGVDAVRRPNAKPRELTVLYYDSDASPCACFADGVAIATYASVGQRTLVIAVDKAPVGDAAVIVIRPRQGGSGFKHTIPVAAQSKIGSMNKNLDPGGRYDAVLAADDLFEVETVKRARRVRMSRCGPSRRLASGPQSEQLQTGRGNHLSRLTQLASCTLLSFEQSALSTPAAARVSLI